MAEKMAETAGGQLGWSQMAEGMALRDAVGSNDAVSAVEQAETRRGNDGLGGRQQCRWRRPVRHPRGRRRHPRGLQPGQRARRDGHILHRVHQLREPVLPDLDVAAAGDRMGHPGPRGTGAAHVRFLHQDRDGARRRADAADPGGVRSQAGSLAGTGFRRAQHHLRELARGRSTSLPITRGVIEALRDEPDQDLLARRLASEVALSSVLEKALLLQRTLLTRQERAQRGSQRVGSRGREPRERHARPGDPQPQDRTNCGASWRTTRRWPSSSAMARARQARAASMRAIRCPTASTSCRRAIREAGHERGAHGLAPCAGSSAGVRRKHCCGRP